MALNNMGLGFIFTARDLASAKLARIERRFQSLDERVGLGAARMSRAFGRLNAGLGLLAAGAAALGGVFLICLLYTSYAADAMHCGTPVGSLIRYSSTTRSIRSGQSS